jgi:DNA-binding NtrC family response regulator
MTKPLDARPVLFVDDEPDNLRLVRLHFEGEYTLLTAANADEALALLEKHEVWAVLTDERMPGKSGIDLLEAVAARWPEIVRVIVSAYGDSARLLAAIHRGRAHEYVLKPWDSATLRACLDRTLARAVERRARARRADLGEVLATPAGLGGDAPMVGWSTGLAQVAELVRRAAPTDAPVLLLGETGTGKELIAQAIHAASPRAAGPLVTVNCGALPETLLESELFGHEAGAFTGAVRARKGRFELSAGGTLFLDEVGEVSPRMQVALLRAIQERRIERVGGQATIDVDNRIVAATNRDLFAMVRDGRFREDLFYRLAVLPIHVPPLRERVGDLPLLVAHFIRKARRDPPLALRPEVLEFLGAYDWPGNVRELENMVQRAIILGDGELTLDDFTFVCPRPPAGDVRDEAQRRETAHLREVLLAHGGNATRAARTLGLPRSTLVSRAQKLGLL